MPEPTCWADEVDLQRAARLPRNPPPDAARDQRAATLHQDATHTLEQMLRLFQRTADLCDRYHAALEEIRDTETRPTWDAEQALESAREIARAAL